MPNFRFCARHCAVAKIAMLRMIGEDFQNQGFDSRGCDTPGCIAMEGAPENFRGARFIF